MRALALSLALLATPAFAQEAAASAGANQNLMSMAPLVLIFGIFYFLLIRPQQRKFKEHQSVLTNLKKGDVIVSGGGKIGKIIKITDDVVTIELAPGVEVKVLKSTIAGLHKPAAEGVTTAPAKTAKKKKDGAVKNDNAVPSKEDVANDN